MAQSSVHDYFSKRPSTILGFPHRLLKGWERRAVFSCAGPLKDARILDLGAGDGYYARGSIKAGAGAITAVDFCDHFLEGMESLRVSTACVDMEKGDLPTGTFDHVFCLGVLEFLEKPKPFLQRLAEKLPSGTRVTLLYPPQGGFFSRLYQRFHRRHGIPVQTFKPGEIQALMWSRGLRLESRKRPHPYAVVETYVSH